MQVLFFMKNDKEYVATLNLSRFTISNGRGETQRVAPVHVGLECARRYHGQNVSRKELENITSKYEGIMSQYKEILDSLDSKTPAMELEDMFSICEDKNGLKVDSVFYEGSINTSDERLRFDHKMSYGKYLELKKPSIIGITRVAKDDITSTFD